MIIDRQGEPVWFRPLPAGMAATNFEVSRYRGQPVLTWWEGKIAESGYGLGEGVIVDRRYRELARVRAANGRQMDLHEFRLTSDGTALLTCYPDEVTADLSSIGGSRHGKMLAPIVQEVDVATGRLLFEWRSLEHVPATDSYRPIEKTYDYLHLNSVSPTPDGNLLVSGRHTWALYKLERRTGRVIWTLGGKRSLFRIGPGARFAWQHDARQLSDRMLTVFDNGSDGATNSEHQSRGLMLEMDEKRRTARLANVYTNPKSLLTAAMGSVQVLPSGRVIVGWGDAPYTSEFAQNGKLIADAGIPSGLFSYRAFSSPWQSVPNQSPAVAAGRDELTGAKLLYASWNGSTEVAGWRVDAGLTAGRTRLIGIARPRGFETLIPLDPATRYASVAALSASNRMLRRSPTIRI